MKKYLTIALACLAGVFLTACSKPESKLAGHIEKVDKIMRDNMDTPKAGADKLIIYLEKNGPDAANILVSLGVELGKIEGDGDREKRAKAVSDALETPLKNLKGTSEKFGEKVRGDKDAQKRFEEYGKRWDQFGTIMDSFERSFRKF